jgi:hypothetical protein
MVRRQERGGEEHGATMAVGAVAGTLAAALVAGSVILVVVLATGAVVGAVVAGTLALAAAQVRGRRDESGDHPAPGLSPEGGPAAQREEAGHTSPSTAS